MKHRLSLSVGIATIALMFAAKPCPGQPAASQLPFFPINAPDGKCGYIDASGRIVIPAQFDTCRRFQDGLAWVVKGLKVGFIDPTGKLVIDAQYDFAEDFSEGLAAIGAGPFNHAKYGFIDRTGRVVVPVQYDAVGRFREGLAAVRIGAALRYIDPAGQVVIDHGDHVLPFEENRALIGSAREFSEGLTAFTESSNLFGCSGWPGSHQPGMQIDADQASSPEGRRLAKECGRTYGRWERLTKWGYMDKSGKVVIPARFDLADVFSGGLARVKLEGQEAYIDHTGTMVLQPKADRDGSLYWKIKPFSQGLAAIRVGDKWGFIDEEGEVVVEPQFDDAGSFVDDRAWIIIGRWVGYIDRTGRAIVPRQFIGSGGPMLGTQYSGTDFSGGLARVARGNGCWGYIDTGGRFVWQFAGRAGEAPCVEPGSAKTNETAVERARTLVAKAEAAETSSHLWEMPAAEFAAAAEALDSYLKSHPDEVETIVLAAHLERFRELVPPKMEAGADVDEYRKAAAKGLHDRVDAMESRLDHAIVIEPRNAELYYWKAQLFFLRAPRFLAGVLEEDGPDLEHAIDSMKKAVELAPDRDDYKEALAVCLIESEHLAEAASTLAGVAGGHHPMSVLLKDLDEVPRPPGAVPDRQDAARLIELKQENGQMLDDATLRIRCWAIPGAAAGVEAFYRARWPAFGFLREEPEAPAEGVTVTGYSELLRREGATLVPVRPSRMRSISDKDAENHTMMTLLEIRAAAGKAQEVAASAALLPEAARALYCVLCLINRHIVGR